MDLKFRDKAPTAEEKSAVDEILGPPVSGWEGRERRDLDNHVARGGREARERRHLLLPTLHRVQKALGWISEGALGYICLRLTIPPAEAYGVADFYTLLSTRPRPPRVAHVCDDIACRAAGADSLCRELEQELGPPGSVSKDATWLRSPCLGLCEKAPAAFVQMAGENDKTHAPTSAEVIRQALTGEQPSAKPLISAPQTQTPREENLRLLRRVGTADPESLNDYRAHGGYAALRCATELGPEGVIREIVDSKVLGRGGAAFPKGIKWEAVAKAPAPHYVVCNADESEPGTFKDRVLMEEDPFAVIEAMTIAGFAVGAEEGFIYIRGEYSLAFQRIESAIARARQFGLLGDNVMEAGFRFDVEIRRGGGAYICGEETALFNSIEGYRGEPRNKPPFPTREGLFGKPTVVNNVETLVNALDILLESGPSFAEVGTVASTGHKLFCVSGLVRRPGVYEVEFGATLREVIGLAGGPNEGRRVAAILLGGAAGSFVPLDRLDIPLTFEGVKSIGASLGSGAVIVFDDTVDLTEIVLRVAAFFRDESCGQCVPCRVGTVRQDEALGRLARGRPLESIEKERNLIDDIAQAMRDASICGLPNRGQRRPICIGTRTRRWNSPKKGQPIKSELPEIRERSVELTIDGREVAVAEGATLLEACRSQGIEIPALCTLETLTPANACRLCVVELEGSRALVPSCSRKVESGAVVHTRLERVRHSRKLVLELLASSVDLSLVSADVHRWMVEYEAKAERFGTRAETVAQPVKIHDELFVRDYSKCILCYKCVEACGEDAQNTFAIAVAGRGFDAHISTEHDVRLDESACVYCGNCIGVCPTGALMFKSEYDLRLQGLWDEKKQSVTRTICPYCGVGCTLDLHVQDNRIVRVTSPQDHSVTRGHLCIKGRFGWSFIQPVRRKNSV